MVTIRQAKKLYDKYSAWCLDTKEKPETIERWSKERDRYKAMVNSMRLKALKTRVIESGSDFAEWEAWAKTLYMIDESGSSIVVHSHAKDWDKSWSFDDQVSALEKIEELIGYKINDRKRGRGDMDKDLESIS